MPKGVGHGTSSGSCTPRVNDSARSPESALPPLRPCGYDAPSPCPAPCRKPVAPEARPTPCRAPPPFPPPRPRLLVRAGGARLLPGRRRALGAGADFLPYWSDRLLGSPFSDMARAGEALRPVADDVIDLGQGAPHFDLTPTAST